MFCLSTIITQLTIGTLVPKTVLGSRVLCLFFPAGGRGGADKLLQLAQQADVDNLHLATYLVTEHLPTSIRER